MIDRSTLPPLEIDPHRLLDPWIFATELPARLAEIATPPEAATALARDAAAPLASSDEVRQRIRALLRAGGFKPTGRSKPASEFLLGAAAEQPLRAINPLVDVANAVSLHSGVPISVVDVDRLAPPLRIAVAAPGSSYVFNPAGQVIDVGGLVCLADAGGPCANAVKDAQRSKTDATTRRTLSLLWSSVELPGLGERACAWYRELLASLGAETVLLVSGRA